MVKVKKTSKLKRNDYVDWLIILFFLGLVSITLIPVLNILALSVSDDYMAIHNKGMLFPKFGHTSLAAYGAILSSTSIYKSFLMSLVYVITATAIHIGVTICGGFSISLKTLPGRSVMITILTITMLFGGGLIPTYLTISSYGLMPDSSLSQCSFFLCSSGTCSGIS